MNYQIDEERCQLDVIIPYDEHAAGMLHHVLRGELGGIYMLAKYGPLQEWPPSKKGVKLTFKPLQLPNALSQES